MHLWAISVSYPELHHPETHLLNQTALQKHAETQAPSEHLQTALEEDASSLELVLAAPDKRRTTFSLPLMHALTQRRPSRRLTFRSSHSMSSRGLLHSFSRSAYFFFSSFSFSRSWSTSLKKIIQKNYTIYRYIYYHVTKDKFVGPNSSHLWKQWERKKNKKQLTFSFATFIRSLSSFLLSFSSSMILFISSLFFSLSSFSFFLASIRSSLSFLNFS